MTSENRLKIDQPACYQICIQGKVPENWNDYFGELTSSISTDKDGPFITTLCGEVPDQAALHGILCHIRDLRLPLISVTLITNNSSSYLKQGENPMSGTRSTKSIVNLVLKAVALAMSVAAIVLNTLNAASSGTMITLLTIGLAALSVSALSKE